MTAAATPSRDSILSLLDLFESKIAHIDIDPRRRAIITFALRLAAKPAEDGVREALSQRLRDAAQTAQNDDLSEPRSEKRQRHIIRIEAMLDAAEYLIETVALSTAGEPKRKSHLPFWGTSEP